MGLSEMVSDYYTKDITIFSERELVTVLSAVGPQVCLLGGWAVFLHVNENFIKRENREYIGSRDIDIGVRVDPSLGIDDMKNSPLGKVMDIIEDKLGYEKSRFGFVKYFERKTGTAISEDDSKKLPLYEIFPVYIDIIPDTEQLDTFKHAFGFVPPSEPLLQLTFEKGRSETLGSYVNGDISLDSKICNADLLAAMKIRSIPKRDKEHKRVKDVCDLHALLWYSDDFNEIKERVKKIVLKEDLNRLKDKIDDEIIVDASNLIGVNKETLEGTIQRLYL